MAPTIGLQLYTIRDMCAENFDSALELVARLGYQTVEFAGLHGRAPEEIRGILDRNGLTACGSLSGMDELEQDLQREIDQAQTLGYSRIVMPYTLIRDKDGAQRLAERLEAAAAKLAGAGVRLGYHNHEFEFEPWPDGSCMYDIIERCPSLFLEIDLGWAWYAGRDPQELLRRHAGRAPLVHVKDFLNRGDRSFRPVGDGSVPFNKILPEAESLGVEVLLVEQDEHEPEVGPAKGIERSINAVRSILAGSPS